MLHVAGTGRGDDARIFQVLSTSGDTHLGGHDFDELLINHVAEEFKRQQGIDVRKDQMALQRFQQDDLRKGYATRGPRDD
jgi:molecular chaperone DnaK